MKVVLFSLGILCNFYSTAQTQNIIESGDVWQEVDYIIDTSPNGRTHRTDRYHKTDGDTVIDGLRYFKLYEAHVYEYETPELEWTSSGFLRQDTLLRRIYVKGTHSTDKEKLWYDFNVTVGDTINNEAQKTETGYDLVVTKDTTEDLIGSPVRMLEVADFGWDCDNNSFRLYDGIGTSYGFWGDIIPALSDASGCLICYSKKGRPVYSSNFDFQNCDLLTGIKSKRNLSINALVFPNPVSPGASELILEAKFTSKTNISIQDVNGRKLKEYQVSGMSPVLQLPELSVGVYSISGPHLQPVRFVVQ
jgi:hypothetical protein